MARRQDKEEALRLRHKGLSYSQIRDLLGVSKSTLSGWLHDVPLSKEEMRSLQHSEVVIEKIRLTKTKKRESRLRGVFDKVSKDIGSLSERELFLVGLCLYWGEGTKAQAYTVALANTDPTMIRFYLLWLDSMGIKRERISIRLHLYSDMDIEKETEFWSMETKIPTGSFRKPYIKPSKFSAITYKTFGHGTCNVIVFGRDFHEYVTQGLKYLSTLAQNVRPPRLERGTLEV